MKNARAAWKAAKLLPIAALLLASPVLAWGPNGHRAVGRIAEHHLSATAARAVADLLAPETLAAVGTWADEIRSDPSWKRADTWHYVTIEDDETYETSTKEPKGDILEAIGRFTKVLADPQAERPARVEALKWLVHLVADLHQPLHVGRRADRGGNAVQVTWFGEAVNLHWLWDEKIVEQEKLSFSELAEFIDHPTAEEVRTWQAAAVLDWAVESFALRSRVYDLGDGKLGFLYQYRNAPLVKRRILQAGVRLAGLLNTLFPEVGASIPDRPPITPSPR